ncbi:hypothetical protein WJX82_003558 [Trebouxia sp. C0006]
MLAFPTAQVVPGYRGPLQPGRNAKQARAAKPLPTTFARSPNDNRSDQMNPNNPAYTDSRGGSGGHNDNRANQLNPNHPGSSGDQSGGDDDNRANQLNPNNPNHGKSD